MAAGRHRDAWMLFGAADRSTSVRLALASCLAVLGAALQGLAPLALKHLVDGFASAGAARRTLVFAALYLAILGCGRLFGQAQAYAFATADQRLQQRFSAASFVRLLHLPLRFHLERPAGSLVQTQALALQGIRLVITHATLTLLPIVIQALVMATVVVSLFDVKIWLVVGAAIAAYSGLFAIGMWRLDDPTRKALTGQVQASGFFADGLANVEGVKAAAAEARLGDRYRVLAVEGEERWRLCHARRFETGIGATLIFVTTLTGVLLLGTSALSAGRITVGDFVLLNAYLVQIVQPLEMAGFALRDLAQGAHGLAKWSEILRVPPEGGEGFAPAGGKAGFSASGRPAPSIRFERVCFAYEPGRPVLTDVELDIPSGGVIAVVGPSGSGKSSLIRLVLRHYTPTSGRILLDGIPVEQIDPHTLRRGIALVTQDLVLFNDTLRQNLMFARPEASQAALTAALSAAQLDDLVARLPHGLETSVGERGLKLSGGEKQRVSIARAILQDASVLILDEATSALDAETERMVAAPLVRSRQGRTTLIITHRLALAAHADAIFLLRDGRVIERGAHGALLAAGGSYAQLWRRQARDEMIHPDLPGLSGSAAGAEWSARSVSATGAAMGAPTRLPPRR